MTPKQALAVTETPEIPLPTTHSALDQVPAQSRVEVVQVESDHGARRQLAQLGIRKGGVLHVVRCAPMGGPILVEVQGSNTVAIGRGLARHVKVRIL